jgi:hypothetical protein
MYKLHIFEYHYYHKIYIKNEKYLCKKIIKIKGKDFYKIKEKDFYKRKREIKGKDFYKIKGKRFL